ncbi:MAG: rhomboid family intramembrane serine protease [Vulcanimicrobiaceae bacterium]
MNGATASSQRLVAFGAFYGPAVDSGQWWRAITGAFMHEGFLHIGFNMFALWQIGTMVERLFGSPKMTVIYFLSMFGSAWAIYHFNYSDVTIGASGAIFGLFGALTAAGLRLGPTGRRLVTSMLGIVLINVLIGFTIPNISQVGHLGGLVAGFLVGMPLFSVPRGLRRAQPVSVDVQSQSGDAVDAELLPPTERRE